MDHTERETENLRAGRHLVVGQRHRLVREIACSFPRVAMCRICRGERDCQFIESRSFGRIVVRKRDPQPLVDTVVPHPITGRHASSVSGSQWLSACAGWVVIALAVALVIDDPANLYTVARLNLAVFALTIIGVPVTRRLAWSDKGGRIRPLVPDESAPGGRDPA